MDPFQKFKRSHLGEELRKYYDEKTADAFLLSFPKCGRTWLRIMIAKVFQQHFKLEHRRIERKLLKLHKLPRLNPNVPKIMVDHDDFPHWKNASELKQNKKRYRHSKVIFLVRDPRDVIVSFYFEQSKRLTVEDTEKQKRHRELKNFRNRVKPYVGPMEKFVHEEIGSFETLIEYYNIWERNREIPRDFLLMKYEDLRANTQNELRRLMDFLELPDVADETLASAIEFCRFENMRKMEQENAFHSGKLAPKNASDKESFKTRKGKVGGYREYLSKEDINYLNDHMREHLSPAYGYQASDKPA